MSAVMGPQPWLGSSKALLAEWKEKRQMLLLHTFEALLPKTSPADPVPMLDDMSRMVNLVKTRLVKCRIFASLCEEMGA